MTRNRKSEKSFDSFERVVNHKTYESRKLSIPEGDDAEPLHHFEPQRVWEADAQEDFALMNSDSLVNFVEDRPRYNFVSKKNPEWY